MSRRLGAFVLIVGFSGCAGEEAPVAPAGNPSMSPAPKPAARPTAPTASEPAPKAAPAAPAVKDAGGPGDAPPLEAPKTGAAEGTVKSGLTDKQLASIKQLPEAEQAAAIKQAVCPVSDEPLGSMGTPIKASAEGRTFYLCCDGCEDMVRTDPKKVLAKLARTR